MKLFKMLLLIYVLFLGACKKDGLDSLATFDGTNNKKSSEFIKSELIKNKKIFLIFESGNQIKNELIENYKVKERFLYNGLPNNELITEVIQSKVIKDKEIMDDLFLEFPYLKLVSNEEWKDILSTVYIAFLNENEVGENKVLLVDKCRDYLISDRKTCDTNYLIGYAACLASTLVTGPFAGPVYIICMSSATAYVFSCYNSAEEKYEICKRPDVE